jgi:hypothetical protein
VEKKEIATHSQGRNKAVDRAADGEPSFPQLSIDTCCFNVVRELGINSREEFKESKGLTVLRVISNALQNLLGDNTTDGDVLSLIEAGYEDRPFARRRPAKEVDPHGRINQDPQNVPSSFPVGHLPN